MIKNVIFDFGNVIGEWNEDKIAANYAENNEEKEILKKVIFKSDEWLKLDSGVLTYQEAIPTFKEKLPDNLKEKVEEIMSTWREKMSINKDICGLIKNFFVDDHEKNIISSRKCGMDGHIFNMNDFQSLLDDMKKNGVEI